MGYDTEHHNRQTQNPCPTDDIAIGYPSERYRPHGANLLSCPENGDQPAPPLTVEIAGGCRRSDVDFVRYEAEKYSPSNKMLTHDEIIRAVCSEVPADSSFDVGTNYKPFAVYGHRPAR